MLLFFKGIYQGALFYVLFSVFGYMKMFLMVLDFILWRREGRTVLEFPLQLACALCCR